MKNRLDQIALATGFSRLNLVGSVLIVAAGLLVFLAAQRAQQLAVALRESNTPPPPPVASVEKRYYGERDYERVAEVLRRNHPQVRFEVSRTGGHLSVSIAEADRYPQWLYALNALQGFSRNLGWEAQHLCVGSCGGSAADASVRAYTQQASTR